MDGIGAKWHYIMETNMEYHGWKQSQMALYNGNGHGIPIKDGIGANWHYIMETDMEFLLEIEPNGITGNAERKIDLHNMKLQIGLHNIFRRTCDFSLLSSP